MSAVQYFDVQNDQLVGRSESDIGQSHFRMREPGFSPLFRNGKVPGETNRHGEIKPVRVTLQEVMFTSRVPLSTWTFVFAINDKLWVSDLTTLYFGKRTAFNKNIFRGKMFVPDKGENLELGITAYNSYGDLFKTSRALHVFSDSKISNAGELIKIDEDWTQLLFKFHVQVER